MMEAAHQEKGSWVTKYKSQSACEYTGDDEERIKATDDYRVASLKSTRDVTS